MPRGDKPYALLITSIDPKALPHVDVGGAKFEPTLLGRDGYRLTGPLPDARAQDIDQRVAKLAPGTFHWTVRYGWVLRERPLAYDFGHYLIALSWFDLLYPARAPLAITLVLTAALVTLLVTLRGYWIRRVLARTYDEATRAVEGELLNHLLVHATPVGLCIVRRGNFEIVVANQIVRNVLGLDEHATRLPAALCDEFETRWPSPGPPPDDDATPVFELPFSLERPGESALHLAITYAPATMNREDVMFCAIADMSKHYEAERLLREAKRMSDEAARAKVSFFAAMSHEIRTPLASLVGNIELVARGPLAPEQGARVQAMQISAEELLLIVGDVLDFSKIDVGLMKLNEDVGSVAALLERIALAHAPLAVRQRLPFYLVMDRALPARLTFDALRLAQIVNNLLSNAFKFTQSGKIVLRALWRDEALEISVSDSGCGIPDDLKKDLFQPFTQGDGHRFTQARGTGLGLSICARLARLMQGRAEIDSTLGVGTRVSVILPLRRDGEATAGDEWTLPEKHPAILCRAPENREWLGNLFDTRVSTPTFLSRDEPPREGTFDYLLVTNEFTPDDVQPLWSDASSIIWLRQEGPLVPLALEGGGAEVSLYSLSGIRAATRMLHPDAATAARSPQRPAGAPGEEDHFPSLTALIAEDNLLNRGVLRDQLRTLGATVVEARDGEQALARLGEQAVNLVFTDLNMPVMNGYELLKAARLKYPHLPIYAVSSNALPEQIAQGRATGFTDYLSKPVTLAELARVLAEVAAQAGSTHSAPDEDAEPPRFPVLAPAVVNLFIEQADHDIADYANIAQQHDFRRLREWAHRVSGGLSVLGPSRLDEACRELRATMHEAGEWTEEVEELAGAIVAELAALRASASQGEDS
ncbi:MAG TPA: ATP-binding protein [Paraburkholderia sp.]|uniref:hybrid sensor histidine kinase/response regulator n=1 Tax=Paraburkholderia sp. TaxID=1926495 RepID=UPI002CBF4AA3|nr:ATP-binding protein [Paraburkholderia sp.]HTR09827.1 ATP-binding protein [Paraburkholderia sp.]